MAASREEVFERVKEVLTEQLAREDGAHRPELEQVLGPRLGVRAGVDEDRGAASRRDHDRDRRTEDAREAADLEQASGEHRAGVAGRHDGVGLSLADGAARGDE